MGKGIIEQIVRDFKKEEFNVLVVDNNDGFLFRIDVQEILNGFNIEVAKGSTIAQRVAFELRNEDSTLLLLNKNKKKYLEDIMQGSSEIEFFLEKYFSGYHIPTIVIQPISILDALEPSLKKLSKQETLNAISLLNNIKKEIDFNFINEKEKLFLLLEETNINWSNASQQLGVLISNTVATEHWNDVQELIIQCNDLFHETFGGVMPLQNSSFIKSPKIVSHILPHLKMKYAAAKIALIVVDGLGLWQYELLKKKLSGKIVTQVINSWLPSITQLSRQAIFRGDIPQVDYRQGPTNEEKLWKEFWLNAGVPKPQVQYIYEPKKIDNYGGVNKLAMVYKDLDEMMHGSKDLQYLKASTEIWIDQSSIGYNVNSLLNDGFTIFIATDHGNVQARGWRALTGREKLGANKSGSKSERHLEYSNKSLYKEFIQNNQDLQDSIVLEEQAIYFKNDLSFSRDESLVTHGGAHILEMLIPFGKITNE